MNIATVDKISPGTYLPKVITVSPMHTELPVRNAVSPPHTAASRICPYAVVMDPMAASSPPPKALPRVPGLKLAPFTPTAYADIEFIEELGNLAVDMDAYIWKARINGAAGYYALKMVSIIPVLWDMRQ